MWILIKPKTFPARPLNDSFLFDASCLILFVLTFPKSRKVFFFEKKNDLKIYNFCALQSETIRRKTTLNILQRRETGKSPKIQKAIQNIFISQHVTRRTLMLFLLFIFSFPVFSYNIFFRLFRIISQDFQWRILSFSESHPREQIFVSWCVIFVEKNLM